MVRCVFCLLGLAGLVVAGCKPEEPSEDGGSAGDSAVQTDASVGADAGNVDDSGTPAMDASAPDPVIEVKELPGSRDQFNGTWWGYNMTKIARRGNRVYSYYIDNDEPPGQPFKFVILRKENGGQWETGAELPTSRPGNILVDSMGRLHAFVFEAFDMSGNDSWGSLIHYTFPTPGDINTFTKETVVDNDGTRETVNIRAGAAIASNDRMTVGWGINLPTVNQSIETYDSTPTVPAWTRSIGFSDLGHDFYYPYLLAHDDGVTMLSIQDDFVAPNENNIYQIVEVFEREGAVWSRTNLVDRTDHPLAPTRRILLETSELYEDAAGTKHAIVKEFLGELSFVVSAFRYFTDSGSGWTEQPNINFRSDCNWIRLFEVDNDLFANCVTYNGVFVKRFSSNTYMEIEGANGVGWYAYLSTPRTGTLRTEENVDLLLITGDFNSYPDGPAYHVQIPKAVLRSL